MLSKLSVTFRLGFALLWFQFQLQRRLRLRLQRQRRQHLLALVLRSQVQVLRAGVTLPSDQCCVLCGVFGILPPELPPPPLLTPKPKEAFNRTRI
jgi:hypothetical protein